MVDGRTLEKFWKTEGINHMNECPQTRPFSDNLFLQHLLKLDFKNFLEIGCNCGQYTKQILELKKDVAYHLGFDVCEDAVASGKKEGLNLIVSSLQEFEANQSYDMVFASGVFMHIPPDEIESLIWKFYCITDRYFLIDDYHCWYRTGRGFRYSDAKKGIWYHDFDSIFRRLGFSFERYSSSVGNNKRWFWVVKKTGNNKLL